MKQKTIIIFLLSIFSLTLFAQPKKVAVYVIGGDYADVNKGVNKVLGDQLVSAFAKSGEYIAIERTANFLAELGKEQDYQRTGAVDDSELSRLGKQFGVQFVCVVEVSKVFDQKYVSARLIDVEKAEVASTASEYSLLDSPEELIHISDLLKQSLLGENIVTKKSTSEEIKFIDLGLPSGTLWTAIPKVYDETYSDAVKWCYKFNAELPTQEQIEELITHCKWKQKMKDGGINMVEICGKKGKKITLKANNDSKYWMKNHCFFIPYDKSRGIDKRDIQCMVIAVKQSNK